MKTQILDIDGTKKSEITTKLFEEPIREDIIYKVVEAEKTWHPNAPKFEAGMARSASGVQRKRRHVWKSDRGKGLSRLPRKIMWRRGTQFSWVGAIVPSARGGRRAHPPKGKVNDKKINKKELVKALFSALTYTSSKKEIQKKYSSLSDKEIKINFPLVIEEKFLTINTKQTLESLKKILGDLPPNSSVTGMIFCEAYCIINRPVVVSPVKAIFAILDELASGLPASKPKPFTIFNVPGGSRSPIISIIASIDTGVCSAGFITTQFPAANAGASFQAAIRIGKFHGMICPTTPNGS